MTASTCVHHCGSLTYRALGRSFNTRTWTKWLREHGLPYQQMPFDSWVVRDVAAKQVSCLVYDWDAGPEKGPAERLEPRSRLFPELFPDLLVDEMFCYQDDTYLVRDGQPGEFGQPKLRVFVSQLKQEPQPFPTTSDCGHDEVELAFGCRKPEDYEHPSRSPELDDVVGTRFVRPVRLTGESVVI